MGAGRFTVSSRNPNDQIGGGGCACSPLANPDQAGPFAIFNATETDNNMSPHTVVCVGCAEAIVARSHDNSEILAAGEDDTPNEAGISL